jgi:hypothetical protein
MARSFKGRHSGIKRCSKMSTLESCKGFGEWFGSNEVLRLVKRICMSLGCTARARN